MTRSFLDLPIEQVMVLGNMRSAVFYKTIEWKRARYHALTILGNSCQSCGSGPSTGATLHVDHIKPRFLYPELCLDISNLQILCSDCHEAKGKEYIDDFKKKRLQVNPIQMREFVRIKERLLIIAVKPPRNFREAEHLADGVISPSKSHRRRFRAFVQFLYRAKLKYSDAIRLTVDEVMTFDSSRAQNMAKFTATKKGPEVAFTIADCVFPLNLTDLLPNRLVDPDKRIAMRKRGGK